MKHGIFLLLLAAVCPALNTAAQTNSTVTIAFSTANPTPLNQGFAGFTTELLGKGEEYGDTNLQHFAAMLSPGWLLFPAGTTGDAFNWATGQTDTNWINVIGMREGPNSNASNLCAGTVRSLEGKGGAWFTNFASMAANLGGAKIIVCVNAFTDTNPSSSGNFAAYALSNHIQVAAWELCNEPYSVPGNQRFLHQRHRLRQQNETLPRRHQGGGFQCRGRASSSATRPVPA